MKKGSALLTLFCIAWIIVSCDGVIGKRKALSKGQRIYIEQCQRCHGAHGNAQINGAKNLQYSELNMEQRIHIITNGKGVMPAFSGNLNPEEIAFVASYLDSLPVAP
ncbi:MAG: c-type cytochrome [Chitinophagales bacterium]